ncbi:MAG: lipopolysaccharide transport periplasmic protein LptA [Legionella sp.]
MNLQRNKQNKQRSLCLMLLGLSYFVYALPEDKTKAIQLAANYAELDQKKHQARFLGHVHLDQGSTHIRAAETVTESNQKNHLIKAIAKGNDQQQAHYWTLTDKDKPTLHAYADIITYYPKKHLIELIGNARIKQNNNLFTASRINYDTLNQQITSKASGPQQTTIIIHPEKSNERTNSPKHK